LPRWRARKLGEEFGQNAGCDDRNLQQHIYGAGRQITDKAEDALARRLLSEKYADDPWAGSPQSLMDWAQAALPMAFDLV